MALPVVARAGRQQRIECRLPCGKRVRGDHIGDRLAEGAQAFERLFALLDVAAVAGREDENLLAVPFRGQERKRRRLAHHHPGRELVGCLLGDASELRQELRRLVERMHDQPGQHLGTERMQLELERGHDAEIAAAAPQCPEQIRVLLRAGANQPAVGRDDVRRDQIVDGQAELAGGPAEAAAEREAGNAGGRVDAERRGEPERLRLLVEVRERGAGLDASRLGRGIDVDRFHQRQIDEETAVAHRVAGDVVAAGAHGNEQLFLARERDRMGDIGGAEAAHHQAGPSVDHGIPDRAGRVVAILSGQGDDATQLAAQGCNSVLRDVFGQRVERADGQVCHVRLR